MSSFFTLWHTGTSNDHRQRHKKSQPLCTSLLQNVFIFFSFTRRLVQNSGREKVFYFVELNKINLKQLDLTWHFTVKKLNFLSFFFFATWKWTGKNVHQLNVTKEKRQRGIFLNYKKYNYSNSFMSCSHLFFYFSTFFKLYSTLFHWHFSSFEVSSLEFSDWKFWCFVGVCGKLTILVVVLWWNYISNLVLLFTYFYVLGI